MVRMRYVLQVAVRTCVNVPLAFTTIRRVWNVIHVMEIHTHLLNALQLPIHNVQLAPSHRMPRLPVVAGVTGRVTRDTISTPPYTVAISVPQRVRGIPTNHNLARLPKTANARVARNQTKHRGTASMAVVGHATRDIINPAVCALRVHHHVQAIRRKRLPAHRHKTACAQVARNRPTQTIPSLQDATGLVILAIMRAVVLALLAPHVQQESMNLEVVPPHKIVNAV